MKTPSTITDQKHCTPSGTIFLFVFFLLLFVLCQERERFICTWLQDLAWHRESFLHYQKNKNKKKTDKNHLTKQQEETLPAFRKARRKIMIGRHVYLSIHTHRHRQTHTHTHTHTHIYIYLSLYISIYIWVNLLKTGQNCDIEDTNSKCELFNVIIWKWKLDICCVHKYKT